MIRAYRKVFTFYGVAMAWLFLLLWPLLGIKPDGTLEFGQTFAIWGRIAIACLGMALLYVLNKSGALVPVVRPLNAAREGVARSMSKVPVWIWFAIGLGCALAYPQFTGRYAQDVAVNVLVYVCLGLGLNIVVGLAGLLDLGYIAFYGVGAYTYALLRASTMAYPSGYACPSPHSSPAWPGASSATPPCACGGDYLAIVTLGFGEIVRIILNNWMSLTNGPNGVMGIAAPGMWLPDFATGLTFEHIYLKKLGYLYYLILGLAIFTIVAVHRLNFSRIGRAWEAIREDETAAELMGVNTFKLKLLAYAMGALFGGLAGAFFAARMRFVSPESFTFLESALVLAMVVLGGLGSIPGIILGALALVALPEIFREFELYRMLAFGGAMTIMMLVRPAGLIPAKRMGQRSEEMD